MRKVIRLLIPIIFICIFHSTYALNASRIVAWPVPFNPNRHFLTIDYAPESQRDVPAPDKIQMTIFDVNGDRVFESWYSSLPIYWYGRNTEGKVVHPGMYIIRLVVEQSSLGTLERRTIRIAVIR
ncbi:MAG: hypothetical protein N2316_04220 [Spirochaetes bacterium]|nr:hypothetical protein [Spirochaetota bacterium]